MLENPSIKENNIKSFRGNGKLLLSGEYFVLDGALALACPTHYGQDMNIFQGNHEGLIWRSFNNLGEIWFEGKFNIPHGKYLEGNDDAVGERLEQMFTYISSVHQDFFTTKNGLLIETRLDFPNEWGLGSSSTLIYNLGKWANINPLDLLKNTMGGSGYDIACAGSNDSILYEIKNEIPSFKSSGFNPPFKENLFFVYLEKKQNSRTGIQYYREQISDKEIKPIVNKISDITNKMLTAKTIGEFKALIKEHEDLVASHLNLKKVKDELFPDFWGEIKSLGAWGGDFVLVASEKDYKETEAYFSMNRYPVFFSYAEIIM